MSYTSSPMTPEMSLPQVTQDYVRPEEGLQVVPPRPDKAAPGTNGTHTAATALPFGLGGWAFGFLMAAVAAIGVGAAVGGGLGAALAECRRSESNSSGGAPTVTVTATGTTTVATETSSTTDSVYTPLPPTDVKALALECDYSEDYRAYTSQHWNTDFEQYCGVDFGTNEESEEGGPAVDLITIVAYSIDDCMDACAAVNNKDGRFNTGIQCRAVTFRTTLEEYMDASGGNCWLKNGTKPGNQRSTREGGSPTHAYARIADS